MKKWVTEIRAINVETGELSTFAGPDVESLTAKLAQEWCFNNGLGYCKVMGQLIMDIPCKKGTYEPDWDNVTDYSKIDNN